MKTLLFLSFVSLSLFGQPDTTDIYNLSLEEILNLKVTTGSLVPMFYANQPVFVTTIQSSDIRATGANNIADLIDIYVPDGTYLHHNQPRIGFRGLISDKQQKTLLLVNGRNINQKGAVGSTLEYGNWDMGDIKSIEIISGPGSVTYGPGAIAGVININTFTPENQNGLRLGIQYTAKYNAKIARLSYGIHKPKFSAYFYSSITTTPGYQHRKIFVPMQGSSDTSWKHNYLPIDDKSAPFFQDPLHQPQLKEHLHIKFYKDWDFWVRYTNSGFNSIIFNGVYQYPFADGVTSPGRIAMQESFQANLKNTHRFSPSVDIQTSIGFDREHHRDFVMQDTLRAHDQGIFGSTEKGNVVYNFLESEWFFRTIGNLERKRYKLALGYEFSYNWFRPQAGKDTMFMAYRSATTSDGVLYSSLMKDGFDEYMHSLLAEGYLEIFRQLTTLISFRYDKHRYIEPVFSPRLAIISNINRNHSVKLLVQQSIRTPSSEDIYKEHLSQSMGRPEILKGIELQYANNTLPKVPLTLVTFYNQIGIRGWGGDKTIFLGDLALWGLTLRWQYAQDGTLAGLSHSYTKQLSWKPSDNTRTQGISFSDYNVSGLVGVGNDLYNWSNHITKGYITARLKERWTLHTDAQVYWQWQGYLDGLQSFDNKFAADTNAYWTATRAFYEEERYGKTDIRVNVRINYRLFERPSVELSVYALNLLGAKRYGYSSGESTTYPARTIWYQEPRVVGIGLSLAL